MQPTKEPAASNPRQNMAGLNNQSSLREGFPVSLHTDQQSLILGEMITARNKLQEENQLLRDKLQDAEMLVKLLQYKLRGQKNEGKKRSKPSKRVALQSRVEHALQWQPGKSLTAPNKSRSAFMNKAAPGKRLFDTSQSRDRNSAASNETFRSNNNPTSECKGRKRVEGEYSIEEKKEDDCATPKEKQNRAIEAHSSACSTEVESVLGKLAQVVINEYATADDDIHIFD